MVSKFHKDELPREKLIKNGISTLTEYELLAIILNTGTKKENVLELSKRITSKYSMKDLSSLSVAKLSREFGIGKAKACKILATFELSRRCNSPEEENIIVKSAKDIINILSPKIAHLKTEHLVCVFLNSRKRIIKIQTIFTGSLNESLINPREIYKYALEEDASAVILVHNHPSNDSTPSDADILSTKEISKAGEVLGIELLDHIIISQDNSYSFRENNLV